LSYPNSKKSTWPKQAAIVVSDSPNVHMLLRELLRSYGWSVIDATSSLEKTMSYIRGGHAYLVIADDTPLMPATRLLRYLLTDPITVCTPVLTLLLEGNKAEAAALGRMGRPVIVDKPLTPSKFVPGFVQLVRTWEKEPYLSLRKANHQLQAGDDAHAIRALSRLKEDNELRQMATQSLALQLRRLGKIKEAESLLLGALKKAPRELGTMMALADLYLNAAMPKLAHRLLLGARTAFSTSVAMMPDLVQSALLMGHIEDAIHSLYILQKANFMEAETTAFLTRLLYAEGREAEAEKILNNNKTALKRIITGWTQAENHPLNAAG
jgi:tetratricopeptide (TPR) repeat protein